MSRKKRFLLFLGYVVFFAFLFECSARLVFFIPQISKRLRQDEDYSWRRAWVSRHQKFSSEIFYKFDIYDSSKGWISKPNLRDKKVFNNKILNTNSQGFRGKEDFPYTKDKKKLRILILGDSFTFGDEVSDNETYPYYLQQMLPQTEVFNMGVHGYGHDQMLILLKEEGVKYKPDIIILGFLPMDMPRNLLKFRDFAKPRFILERGKLRLTDTPVPHPEDILQWDWIRPRVFDVFLLIRHEVRKLSGQYEKDIENITSALLTNMIEYTESIHAIPVLVYLPYGEENSNDTDVMKCEAYMFSLCQLNERAKCYSTRSYFGEKIAKEATFKSREHWGPAGHRAAAQAIKRYLVNEGLVTMP